MSKNNETKSYVVKAIYWNEVHDAQDSITLDVFAKDLNDLEKQVKKYCGKSFMFIEYTEVSQGLPVF